MIMPHGGDVVSAKINDIAFQYNVPLIKSDCQWTLPTFQPLYLQAAKRSEDGTMTVIRLSEQNGARGQIKLERPVKLLNMLEEVIGESDVIEYSPFEIVTVGIDKE
jgi:alpha-mannosidase